MRTLITLSVGWLLFVLSFFLPVTEGYSGLGALLVSLEEGFPSYSFFSSLTNVVMLATPLVIVWKSPRFGKILCFLIMIAAILNLYWIVSFLSDVSLGDLRFGYYVWWLSFVVVAVALWRMARDEKTGVAESESLAA